MLQNTEFEKTHLSWTLQGTPLHFDSALEHRLDVYAMRVTISVPTKRTDLTHTLLMVQRCNCRLQEKKKSKHVDVDPQRKWQDEGRYQEDTRSACHRPHPASCRCGSTRITNSAKFSYCNINKYASKLTWKFPESRDASRWSTNACSTSSKNKKSRLAHKATCWQIHRRHCGNIFWSWEINERKQKGKWAGSSHSRKPEANAAVQPARPDFAEQD